MFGTPIAALDVVLGIAGVDGVMRGLRQVDRELRAQQQYRNPQQIVAGRQAQNQVENARAMSRVFGTGAGAVGQYQRALDRLSKTLNAPTKNYGAAREAERQIMAAQKARAAIAGAEEQVRRFNVANAFAQRRTRQAGLDLTEQQQILREMPTRGKGSRRARRAQRAVIVRAQRTQLTARTASNATQNQLSTAQLALTKIRADSAGILKEAEGAVGRFFNAMRGLNPLQYLAGVFGAVADVGRSAFGVVTGAVSGVLGGIMSLGTLGFNVIKGGIGIVTGLGKAFMGVAGFVGNAASGVLSFLAMPVISAPLTGGLSLIVQHFDDIIRLAGLAGAAVVGFAAQQIVSQGMTYEASLSGVRAAAGYSPGMGNNPGAVEQQLQRLGPIILRIGADTKFNNAEVAKGIELLLSGGLQIQQINMLTARSLFDVAAATNSSVEDSAKVIDATVQLFKVPESQIVHAGDVIAGVVNSSLMDMGEFGSALRQLGPLANTLGISFEDTATALTVLAGAGFRGEIGGTALRNMLIYLNPRSDKAASELKEVGLIDAQGKNQFFDEKGNLKGFEQIFALLRKASAKMNDEEQLEFFTKVFGTRSASTGMVYAGLDPAKFGQTQTRIGQQSAGATANTRLDNVAGRVEILTGSLQSLASVIFMNWLKSPLNGMLDFMIRNTNVLLDFAGNTDDLTESYKGLFGQQSRLSAFVGLLGQFLSAGNFSTSEDFVAGLREIFAMGGAGRLMDLLPFIRNVEPWIRKLTRALQLGRDTVLTFAQAWRGEWGGALTQSINPLVRIAGIFGTYWGKIWGAIRDLLSGKVSLGQFLGELSGAFGDLLLQLGTLIDTEGPGVIEHFKELGKYLKALGTAWWTDYLQPEVNFLWGKLQAWLTEKKPTMIAMWNDLWSAALGVAPPKPENPDFGISTLGTNDQGESATPATSLGRVINTLFDNATDLVRDKAKPLLDELLKALRSWWADHHQEVEDTGKHIGAVLGSAMLDGLKFALGRGFSLLGDTTNMAWIAAWEKMFPGTFKKSADGKILLDQEGKPFYTNPDPGPDPNGVGVPSIDPNQRPPKPPDSKLTPGNQWAYDPVLNYWYQKAAGAGAAGGGAGGTGTSTPPGTIPTAMPRVGEGGMAAAEAIKEYAAMMATAVAAAMVPRQIYINGTGLTPAEFYQQLAAELENFFAGRASSPQLAGGGGGGGGAGGFTP